MGALQLLQVSDGKFSLCEEALNVIRSVRGPVAIAAVCGRARQGKSYILNSLAKHHGSQVGFDENKADGFVVGPTTKPCTKGLWLWSHPLERTAADGSKYSVLLIDTEGIDAYGNKNVSIF